MMHFVNSHFTLISIIEDSNKPIWALTPPPRKALNLLRNCGSFVARELLWSELLRESEKVGKLERRNSGKEARKAAPLTCFELIVKCNKG